MIREKYSTNIKETTLNVVQTEIESVRKKDISKTGLRLYKDGFIGVSGAIGNYDELELQERAEKTLSLKIPYPHAASRDMKEQVSNCPEIIKDTDFPAEIEALLSELRQQQPKFTFFHKIKLVEQQTELKNEQNLDLQYKDRHISIELAIKEKASANLLDAFTGYQGRVYDRNQFVQMANDICNAFLNPVEMPKGAKLPAVYDASHPLPLKKLITDLNGQLFATGSSLFSGKLNEEIFNTNFSLYQSLHPEASFQPFFDAEGVVNPGYSYPLIENGRLMAPYTDKKTAAQFDLPLTGSAAAEYDSVPSLGYLNFKLKESNKTLKELLGGQMGIFVLISEGGDFTPNGDFATPVQLAFLFDGEKLIGRLPELQLSSNVFKMFGEDFVGVGKNKLHPLASEKYMVLNMDISK